MRSKRAGARGVIVALGPGRGRSSPGPTSPRLERCGEAPRRDRAAVRRRPAARCGRSSKSPWPSVAVIDGVCLGGGLELRWPAISAWLRRPPARSSASPKSSWACCRAGRHGSAAAAHRHRARPSNWPHPASRSMARAAATAQARRCLRAGATRRSNRRGVSSTWPARLKPSRMRPAAGSGDRGRCG